MRRLVLAAAPILLGVLMGPGPAWADDIAGAIQDAGANAARGDALHALSALQTAENALSAQLAAGFAKVLPPVPAGWEQASTDDPPLDVAGGGFTLSRGYQKGESSLTVLVIADNPAVSAATALFQPGNPTTASPEWSKITAAGQPALLRWDASMNEGELLIIVDGRALLEIDGDGITNKAVLTDAAKGWDVAGVRKLLAGG
jgi:hypothetical protein